MRRREHELRVLVHDHLVSKRATTSTLVLAGQAQPGAHGRGSPPGRSNDNKEKGITWMAGGAVGVTVVKMGLAGGAKEDEDRRDRIDEARLRSEIQELHSKIGTIVMEGKRKYSELEEIIRKRRKRKRASRSSSKRRHKPQEKVEEEEEEEEDTPRRFEEVRLSGQEGVHTESSWMHTPRGKDQGPTEINLRPAPGRASTHRWSDVDWEDSCPTGAPHEARPKSTALRKGPAAEEEPMPRIRGSAATVAAEEKPISRWVDKPCPWDNEGKDIGYAGGAGGKTTTMIVPVEVTTGRDEAGGAKPKARMVQPSAVVCVGNLSFSTSWQHLKDRMWGSGEVVFVDVMTNAVTGRSKGCALVGYATSSEAQAAIEWLTDTVLKGRTIFVSEDREAVSAGGAKDDETAHYGTEGAYWTQRPQKGEGKGKEGAATPPWRQHY